jgi:hypothetical protein
VVGRHEESEHRGGARHQSTTTDHIIRRRRSAAGDEEDNESLDPVRSCSVPSRGEDFVVSFIGNSWWGASAWYSYIVSSVGNSWWLASPVGRCEAGLLGRLTAGAVIEPIEELDRVRASLVWKFGLVRGLWKDRRGRSS